METGIESQHTQDAVSNKVVAFKSLSENVGRFNLKDKHFLIPQMNRIGSHLLAAVFRGFGIQAQVMDTYKGLEMGNRYTSGKECYPCQITMGDILYFMQKEKERLRDNFDPNNYIYFMPEADGPCRFGMYNKYQRIVLDSFPELKQVRIGSLTTGDGYSLDGLIENNQVKNLRKTAYFSVIISDILDRLLWRIRPYEKKHGITDDFIEGAMKTMEDEFETYGPRQDFERILVQLEKIIKQGKTLIDPQIPPKPRIGIVGEIYLRTHVQSNQDVIRVLERYGAEVVNASIAEWINFTTYERLREAKMEFRLNLKQFHLNKMLFHLKKIRNFGIELMYQQYKQNQVYKRARSILNIAEDHTVGGLENTLKKENIFCFDIGTEACLSIPAIMEYARHGCNGIVNIYPFTCMPSTMTSSIIKPLMNKRRIPYLDTPYDSSSQPGREAAIRTFMFQAQQHFNRNGGK